SCVPMRTKGPSPYSSRKRRELRPPVSVGTLLSRLALLAKRCPGKGLTHARNGGVVLLRAEHDRGCGPELAAKCRERRRRAGAPGDLHGNADILGHQVDGEPAAKAAGQDVLLELVLR